MKALRIGTLVLLLSVGTEVLGAEPSEIESEQAIPVIWQVPDCAHKKLGLVTVSAGRSVDASTRDLLMPAADYDHAFAKLAEAAREKGGNAVVIRWHQATFFTRNTRRSPKPVHVQLKGAAIRLTEERAGCELAIVDPLQFEERAVKGEPIEVAEMSGDSD